ncbi:MAG: elongation factor G [Dehalococcoidales bacterium]|nr:elongation factor G [Dehalococcoidales bacterium]
MAQYGLANIRNTVLLSHANAGKTSIAEAVLFTAGVINRLGKVEDGSTTSDYDPDEQKRRISINLSVLPLTWKDTKINLLDSPGYFDFVGEVKAGIRVCESAIIIVDAASGAEFGTEQVWGFAGDAKLARLIFVNKMDRENADFLRTVEGIQAKFGSKCLPVQIPIGAHTDFKGVIDLLTKKAYTGTPAKESPVPAELEKQVGAQREKLVEAIAENDDKLLEKYLGGEELTLEELKANLRKAILTGKITPVLAGSGLQNIGISQLMDTVCEFLPAPKEVKVQVGNDLVEPKEDAPLAALVFKTSADPYVGKLTYFRVYNGVFESNSQVWNSHHNSSERIGQLFLMRGKTQEAVPQVRAGDIGVVAKLTQTSTNDTLCKQDKPVKLAPIVFPKPVFSLAVHPKTKADIDKMGSSLARLVEEDPTLHMRREMDTAETIISGIGETQIAVAGEKLQRKFGVGVELSTPKVPFKETITQKTEAEYKHKKQSGGHGQYGHVFLELEPKPRGTGNEFAERVVGGTVPRNFIPAVEKGVNEAFAEGTLARFPVVDVRATLFDGSFHPVDSSEICFKIAGAGAFKKGFANAHPILIEPIMDLKVTAPGDLTGDIISDLNTKRARVLGMNPEGGNNVIEAEVPLAEAQHYAIDLKSKTQGRGTFTMEFKRYEEMPAHISQKIIAEKQKEQEVAKEEK